MSNIKNIYKRIVKQENSISIPIIRKINGVEKTFRSSFDKYFIDDNGDKIENPNFEKEVDAWTGEKDFIKNRVNI